MKHQNLKNKSSCENTTIIWCTLLFTYVKRVVKPDRKQVVVPQHVHGQTRFIDGPQTSITQPRAALLLVATVFVIAWNRVREQRATKNVDRRLGRKVKMIGGAIAAPVHELTVSVKVLALVAPGGGSIAL